MIEIAALRWQQRPELLSVVLDGQKSLSPTCDFDEGDPHGGLCLMYTVW